MQKKLENLIARLTIEEKAALCSGLNFWETTPIASKGIPSVMLTDGPHGVRKEIAKTTFGNIFQVSEPATCFPPAVTLASTWDVRLAEDMGQALGEESLDQGVSTILGPGINIKRSPLCGRNFEYMSEDPLLSGEMGASYIKGCQSTGVGTSLKHYAVNSQEYRRMVASSEVDERTLREIYLSAFEIAVKKAQPHTIMCSYNPINGVHASDNKKLLWDILREEWGFKGIVISDWGAVNDRVKGIIAGMDLEMPSSNGIRDRDIVRAVQNGKLKEEQLNATVKRILEYVFTCAKVKLDGAGFVADYEKHHRLARQIAADGSVLLKNENGLLPLNSSANFAVIGQLAKKPRYQGSGSSRLNPKRVVGFLDYLDTLNLKYAYSAGYTLKSDGSKNRHLENAVERAKDKDYVIVFAGLTDIYESESFDREHLDMPEGHNELISALCEVNKNVIVVLVGGSPVVMPWIEKVGAVLNVYLGGEATGEAVYDILFGAVNPSGRLAETYPIALSDILSSKYFLMGPNTVEYRESVFVGYRYFDSAKKDVAFPFGYGLSYTKFSYSKLEMSASSIRDTDKVTVSCEIANIGKYDGAEVVQLYIKDPESTVFRPEKELKGFKKVFIRSGEKAVVSFELDKRAFAFYNVSVNDWTVESGKFIILLGSSSRDIKLETEIEVIAEAVPIIDYRETAACYYNIADIEYIDDKAFETLMNKKLVSNAVGYKKGTIDFNSVVGDLGVTWFGKIFKYIFTKVSTRAIPKAAPTFEKKMVQKGALNMPVRNFYAMSGGVVPYDACVGLIMAFNGHLFKGLFKVLKSFIKKGKKKTELFNK